MHTLGKRSLLQMLLLWTSLESTFLFSFFFVPYSRSLFIYLSYVVRLLSFSESMLLLPFLYIIKRSNIASLPNRGAFAQKTQRIRTSLETGLQERINNILRYTSVPCPPSKRDFLHAVDCLSHFHSWDRLHYHNSTLALLYGHYPSMARASP